ncbi:hypothetical protein CBR_g21848 [Chara braunii]|uniref:Small ribosomal subunit protein uS9c n=1 Tax=Chara braunii TaxID=69332 RepID=A0A388JUP4_CHABU|nr:hypothetical protein CBR_g21848 [Chara braunii]|eukprot:GBG61505.1 hypothetical protein CBR_g21848 [Chara braunii]
MMNAARRVFSLSRAWGRTRGICQSARDAESHLTCRSASGSSSRNRRQTAEDRGWRRRAGRGVCAASGGSRGFWTDGSRAAPGQASGGSSGGDSGEWEGGGEGAGFPGGDWEDAERGERGEEEFNEVVEGFEFLSEGTSIESLITLRNLDNVRGLPPLHEILSENPEEEERRERREKERERQEEIAKARVRVVDDLGRSYGTGKRKESIARVWIEEGDGKILVNGKEYDLYFRDIAARNQVLLPFMQTKSLGKFDVKSTVQGGGISGQAGAMRHGISKALLAFSPEYRAALKEVGLLTRDSRVVERKKPGKAKARRSFQWVKR